MKLAAFLIILTIVRFVAIGQMELSPDEAYYHEWSKQLDWCYYSKGPGVAATMHASTAMFGHSAFGIRFFAPVLALGTSLILYWLARRMYDDRVAFWTVGIMNLTPLFNVGGLMMTIDPLSIFFWAAAMATVWLALEKSSDNEPRFSLWWPLSGLLIGAGFLCKWTNALQLLSIVLLLLLTPRCRKELLRPGFWSMVLVALTALIPVYIWQSANGFPVLTHLSARGGLETPWWKISFKDFGAFVASHFGVYSPLLFLGMMIALWSEIRESCERWAIAVGRSVPAIPHGLKQHWGGLTIIVLIALAFYFAGNFWDEYAGLHKGAVHTLVLGAILGIYLCKPAANVHWRARYLAAYAVPILLMYLWISLHHDSEVNWTAPGMVGLFILTVAHYMDRVSRSLVQWTCGVAAGISIIAAQPDLVRAVGVPWPANRDHTTRTRGWAESARAVDRVRTETEQQLKLERPIFIIGENYGVTSELCYYLPEIQRANHQKPQQPEAPGHPLCYVPESVVAANQYYYWGRYDEYVERNIPENMINDQQDSVEFGVCPFAGRTAIYVTTRPEGDPPDILKDTFADWQYLRDVEVKENGRVLRTLRFFLCHRYLPGKTLN